MKRLWSVVGTILVFASTSAAAGTSVAFGHASIVFPTGVPARLAMPPEITGAGPSPQLFANLPAAEQQELYRVGKAMADGETWFVADASSGAHFMASVVSTSELPQQPHEDIACTAGAPKRTITGTLRSCRDVWVEGVHGKIFRRVRENGAIYEGVSFSKDDRTYFLNYSTPSRDMAAKFHFVPGDDADADRFLESFRLDGAPLAFGAPPPAQ